LHHRFKVTGVFLWVCQAGLVFHCSAIHPLLGQISQASITDTWDSPDIGLVFDCTVCLVPEMKHVIDANPLLKPNCFMSCQLTGNVLLSVPVGQFIVPAPDFGLSMLGVTKRMAICLAPLNSLASITQLFIIFIKKIVIRL